MKIVLTLLAIVALIHNVLRFEHLHQTVESDTDFILILLAPFILFIIAFFAKESSYKEEFEYVQPLLAKVFVIGVVVGGFILMFAYPFDTPGSKVPSQTPYTKTFYGYECTDDCRGHEEGFDWAKRNNIEYTSDCGGNSRSFIEGCQAWVKNSPDPFPEVRE